MAEIKVTKDELKQEVTTGILNGEATLEELSDLIRNNPLSKSNEEYANSIEESIRVVVMSSKKCILDGIARGLNSHEKPVVVVGICAPEITRDSLDLTYNSNAVLVYSNIDNTILKLDDHENVGTIELRFNYEDLVKKAEELTKNEEVLKILGYAPSVEDMCEHLVYTEIATSNDIEGILASLPTKDKPVLLKDLLGIKE